MIIHVVVIVQEIGAVALIEMRFVVLNMILVVEMGYNALDQVDVLVDF